MTTQGARNTRKKNPLVVGTDIDALLADAVLEPAPVTLGGKTYTVRTDLTGDEVSLYVATVNAGKHLEALTLLVGPDDAVTLQDHIKALPRLHQRIVNAEIMRASRALADFAASVEEILNPSAAEPKPGKS